MECQIRAKVWLVLDDGTPFCHGKAELLAAIAELGSIRQAAQRLRMSYRRAWEYVRDLEAGARFPVVETQVGGPGGGGARLTAQGTELLQLYQKVHREIGASMAARQASIV
jgi:molybdate transport system regulatory protein